MNRSRGTLSFHRLFSTQEIGLGNHAEHFTNVVIRQFLNIGEAVAGCWIEMPLGVLILQMVPGRPGSGAIYLYDRKQQIFYLLGFDGEDDNLTLEEFNAYGWISARQATDAKWPREARDLVRDYLLIGGERYKLITALAEISGHPCDACLRFARELGVTARRFYRVERMAELVW